MYYIAVVTNSSCDHGIPWILNLLQTNNSRIYCSSLLQPSCSHYITVLFCELCKCYDATFTTVYPNKITQTISFKYKKFCPVNTTNKQPITSLQFVQLQNWNRSYREGCGIPHPRKPTARIVDHRLATSHRSTNRRTSPTNWLQIFIEKVAQGLVDFIYCYYYYCIIKPPSQTQWWGFFLSPRK